MARSDDYTTRHNKLLGMIHRRWQKGKISYIDEDRRMKRISRAVDASIRKRYPSR